MASRDSGLLFRSRFLKGSGGAELEREVEQALLRLDKVIDSVDLSRQTLSPEGENWIASIDLPTIEEIFKIALTTFDETTLEQFTVPNATRLTTAGPVVLDSVTYTKNFGKYYCRPYITNKGDSSIHNISGKLICNDAWVTTINPSTWSIQNLPPDVSTPSVGALIVSVIDTLFPAYFNFEAQIGCDNWPYWEDSIQIIVGVEKEDYQPLTYRLEQNYPNPFNPTLRLFRFLSVRRLV